MSWKKMSITEGDSITVSISVCNQNYIRYVSPNMSFPLHIIKYGNLIWLTKKLRNIIIVRAGIKYEAGARGPFY